MQREEMGLGSNWGKVVVEAHHELLHGLTPALQLAEAGVPTTGEPIMEVVGTKMYVVSNACLRRWHGIGAVWGMCPSHLVVGYYYLTSRHTLRSWRAD